MAALKDITQQIPSSPSVPASPSPTSPNIAPITAGVFEGAEKQAASVPLSPTRITVDKAPTVLETEQAPMTFSQAREKRDTLFERMSPSIFPSTFKSVAIDLSSFLKDFDRPECKFSRKEKLELLMGCHRKIEGLRDFASRSQPEFRDYTINPLWEDALNLRIGALSGAGSPSILMYPDETLLVKVGDSSRTSEGGGSVNDKVSKLFWFAMGLLVGGLGMYAFNRFYKR
jgi:hypothetical protein